MTETHLLDLPYSFFSKFNQFELKHYAIRITGVSLGLMDVLSCLIDHLITFHCLNGTYCRGQLLNFCHLLAFRMSFRDMKFLLIGQLLGLYRELLHHTKTYAAMGERDLERRP